MIKTFIKGTQNIDKVHCRKPCHLLVKGLADGDCPGDGDFVGDETGLFRSGSSLKSYTDMSLVCSTLDVDTRCLEMRMVSGFTSLFSS